MSDQPPDPAAAGRVAADPFWSVVRRRHPDLDLVLLPEEPAPAADPVPPVTLSDRDVARLDERAARAWAALAGRQEVSVVSRWVAGDRRGVVRRENAFTHESTDPVTGAGIIERAVARLRTEGWRVLSPPDGVPRVMASRADGEELQLVLVPATGRLTLRTRAAGVPVGIAAAHDLLTEAR